MTTAGRTKGGLRQIAAPFVVPAPAGARTRTRLHLTDDEAAALEQIGAFLGSQYRTTLSGLLDANPATTKDQAGWRAQTKRHLTAATSSRWAGTITRTALDARRLGIQNLYAERRSLTAAIDTISARLAAPVGGYTPAASKRAKPVKGYPTTAERFQKSRRKAVLSSRLADVQARITAGRPRIAVGGARLWSARTNLDAAQLTTTQWQRRWSARRLFLTADGETGQVGGNLTIRVIPGPDSWRLEIKVPGELVPDLGDRILLSQPVSLATHLGGEWAERITARRAIRYDITVREDGRWYLDASWGYPDPPELSLPPLQAQCTLAVDLNDGHADVAVIDPHGNVTGTPRRVEFTITGTATYRDAQVRHLVTRLIHLACANRCASISIENLGFTDAPAIGRETMGRGSRGKAFRRTVAGLPTAALRTRLVAMCAAAALAVIAVDPAYTSRWAKQHWLTPLQTSDPTVDGHRAAATVIGRRSIGHRARRKPVGPHARQRTNMGQPAGPAVHGPDTSRPSATRPPTPQRKHQTDQAHGTTRTRKRRSQDRSGSKYARGSLKRTQ